jgi:hypothetical protein
MPKLPEAPERYDRTNEDQFRRAVEIPLDDLLGKSPLLLDELVLPFSATPIFDLSRASCFVMTLTANVTSSTLINGRPGQPFRIILKQDPAVARTYVPPTNLKGSMVISAGLSTVSAQDYVFIASLGNAYATSPGVVGM